MVINLNSLSSNSNRKSQCQTFKKRSVTLTCKKTYYILSPADLAQMNGPDPKWLNTSQTGFRTWHDIMFLILCMCWYQLVRMGKYKRCVTNNSIWLVKTHSQIGQVISEIYTDVHKEV